MRIAYVNHSRFPTEKAHGVQIAQVSDAMAALGHEVEVLCTQFQNSIEHSPQTFYGLSRELKVIRMTHFNAFHSKLIPGFLGFAASMPSYGRSVRKYLQLNPQDLLYVRSPLLLRPLLRTGIPVIVELHSLPRFLPLFVPYLRKCRMVVCLTSLMRAELIRRGVPGDRVIVESDAVDVKKFTNPPADAKNRWQMPSGRPVIGYIGSLVTRETLEKGVRELIDAMPDRNLRTRSPLPFCWIVGGPEKWQAIYEEHAAERGLTDDLIRFQGRIEPAQVPSAIAACDVCVYPAPKTDHPYFMRDTSPLKLFEYLAAGRPVVCADIPPIRDVVSDKSVKFFRPGDAADLAAAITDVLDHPEEASKRAEEGKRIASEHTWEKRMQRILEP